MGSRVVYLGDAADPRTARAREMVPPDLDVSFVDPASNVDMASELADCEFLVAGVGGTDEETLRLMPRLKALQILSAGFDRIDVIGLRERGIEVCNNSAAIANSVAEHAIMLMLAVYKRVSQSIDGARDGGWQAPAKSGPYGQLFELTHKTVGIVGTGHIGSNVARRLRGFETTTLYSDVRALPPETERELAATRVPLEELLERSDIVTVHTPLNSVTRGMFGAREFRLMQPHAVFINTCRGPVHDEDALLAALNDGEIRAAGLDVTEVEPTPADSPLLAMENVVVTPHIAGSTEERVDRAIEFSYANATRVLNGEKPLSAVVIQD